MLYFLLRSHALGAIVILGTGTGIAFFMLMAHRSRDVAFIARTAETVVIADVLFTLTAVLLQPVTGGVLMMLSSMRSTNLADGLAWALCGRRAVLGARDLHADPNARPRMQGGCGKPGVAAETLCTFPPLVSVWDSRFGSDTAILWLMIAKPL